MFIEKRNFFLQKIFFAHIYYHYYRITFNNEKKSGFSPNNIFDVPLSTEDGVASIATKFSSSFSFLFLQLFFVDISDKTSFGVGD